MYGIGTVSQAVSRWPLTVEARFRVLLIPCGICGGKKWHLDTFLSELFFYFPCQYHSTVAPSIHISPGR
jgi:hypothetical protein